MSKILLKDIITDLSDEHGIAKADVSKLVRGTFDIIELALAHGDDVQLTGFGTFTTAERPERTRNVFGKPTIIPALTQVKFKPGKNLRDTVAG